MFKIKLLGAFSASLDGEPVSFRSVTVQALLIYLAAEIENGPHRREALSELIWPGMPPASGRKNLRQTLYELRQAIPKAVGQASSTSGEPTTPLILSDRRTIQLNPEADFESDVALFEELLSEKSPDSLPAAVDLYRDDFLSDFYLPGSAEFEEWAAAKRAYYRRLAIETMSSLAQSARDRGDFDQAADYSRRQLDLDHFQEPAHRQLMEVLALGGRRPEALNHYDQLCQILREELDVEPSAGTVALYEAIVSGQVASPEDAARQIPDLDIPLEGGEKVRTHNLPPQATAFVGREEELEGIQRLLVEDPVCRLLTLLGPGGSGKTRLAIEAAKRISTSSGSIFPDGAWFVPLDNLVEPDSIVPSVANALDFNLYAQDEPVRQLLDYLRGKRMLLLLDNCEHLLQDGVTPLAADILMAAPEVKVLVTSRSQLNAHGERIMRVDGLSLPHSAYRLALDEAADFGALRLFQQSARLVEPLFAITAENLLTIFDICRLLQGMPLGIELAAAWISLLSAQEIAAEIGRSLDFLEAQWQDIPERQRSLRAVFEGSWRMISGREREIVAALSVFQSSFARKAAQEISGVSLRELLTLVGRSWLAKDISGDFQIHVMLRQFGREKLRQDEEAWKRARSAHAAYHAAWLEQLNLDMRGPAQKEAFETISRAFGEMRSAWDYLLEQGQWIVLTEQMSAGLLYFTSGRDGQAGDVLAMVRKAREACIAGDCHPFATVVLGTAEAALTHGYYAPKNFLNWIVFLPLPKDLIREAWSATEGIKPGQVDVLWLVLPALLYGWQIDREAAVQRLRKLESEYRLGADRWALAFALEQFGRLLSQAWFPATVAFLSAEERQMWETFDTEGHLRLKEGDSLLDEAAAIWGEIGDKMQRADTLRLQGLEHQRSDTDRSMVVFEEARGLYQQLGLPLTAAGVLEDMAGVSLNAGEVDLAFQYYQESHSSYEKLGNRRFIASILSRESIVTLRYVNPDQARKTRGLSLAIAREMEDEHQIAWGTWELGEIERIDGNLEAARRLYEDSFELFTKNRDSVGLCFYFKGMGDLALVERQYDAARRLFHKALVHAQEVHHVWSMSYCRCGIARAEIGAGRHDEARVYLDEAIRDVRLICLGDLLPLVLTCFAQWHAASGDLERAIVLGNFAANLKKTWQETRGLAEAVVESASDSLSSEVVLSAIERSRKLDIPSAVLLALSVDADSSSKFSGE
jgi:predicted ATPase/DNA-binding SARP family transcriptional activator